MGALAFDPMAVRDGARVKVIRSFDDLRKLVAPTAGLRPIGIAKKILDAQTEDEKEEAVLAFRAWARVAGLLEREMA